MPRKKTTPQKLAKKAFYENKRAILSFCITIVFFFITFACLSLGSIGISGDWREHFSKTLNTNLIACKVKSSNEKDNYRQFFSYADDIAGREIKSQCDTYVVSTGLNGSKPAIIPISETESINVDTALLYTTWSFHKFNYGFETYTKKPTQNLTAKEIYINMTLAKSLAQKYDISLDDIIGSEIKFNSEKRDTSVKILDIITNLDSLNIGPYFSGNVLIGSYHYLNNRFINMEYVFVMRGGTLSKNYCINYVENAIDKLSQENLLYDSKYYSLIDNVFVDDGFNTKKQNLVNFYSTHANRIYSLFFIGPLICWLSLILLSWLNIIGRESLLSLYISGLIYVIVLSITHFSFVVSGASIFLSTKIGAVILFSFLFCTMAIYYLFENGGHGKAKETK